MTTPGASPALPEGRLDAEDEAVALENALVEYDETGELFGTSGAGAYFLASFLVGRGWRAALPEGRADGRARVFSDRQELEDCLLDANYEHGETPELAGYDKAGRPVVAWLFDGGDDAPMAAAILGGEDAGHPWLVDIDPDDLLYPVTVLVPASWSWSAPVVAAPEAGEKP